MDLLFKRYASPLLFLDQMILTEDFSFSVDKIIEFDGEEKLWQVYLHKVFDKSYDELKEEITRQQKYAMSKSQIETTVKNSYQIIKNYNPQT